MRNGLKKLVKALITLFIVIAVIFILMVVAVVLNVPSYFKTDTGDISMSYSTNIYIENYIEIGPVSKEDKNEDNTSEDTSDKWYDSIDSAMDDNKSSDFSKLADLMICLETDTEAAAFYLTNDIDGRVAVIKFHKENDRYSAPYQSRYEYADINNSIYADSHYFRLNSAAAWYIFDEYNINSYLKSDDGNDIFFGFWTNEDETKSLSVCGKPVNVVDIPIQLNDKTIYMWYIYMDNAADKMSKVNYSHTTLNTIAQILEIESEIYDDSLAKMYAKRRSALKVAIPVALLVIFIPIDIYRKRKAKKNEES
ncbi:MAG: hypothetical protein IJ763_04170 [Lachnospiraceae bacterium]|nr:hypothetical protein [Lachnospiraceae bacterium]